MNSIHEAADNQPEKQKQALARGWTLRASGPDCREHALGQEAKLPLHPHLWCNGEMLDLGPRACTAHPCVLWRALRSTLL